MENQEFFKNEDVAQEAAVEQTTEEAPMVEPQSQPEVQAPEEEAEPAIAEPSLDDLDDVPQSERYRVITTADEIKEGTQFTISGVRLRAPSREAKVLESKNGLYIKEKLELKFEEEFNGDK